MHPIDVTLTLGKVTKGKLTEAISEYIDHLGESYPCENEKVTRAEARRAVDVVRDNLAACWAERKRWHE